MTKFDNGQLFQFEELKIQLGDNFRLLGNLRKPTHEFKPIKRENLEKEVLYSDPEGPIKFGLKTSGPPLVEKCSKCGTKRRSTPVDIG